MTEDQAIDLLRERGAIRNGHFLLSSGLHSETYVEKARVFEDAVVTGRLGAQIAAWFERIEAVVSPAVGAIPLGFAVALASRSRFLYAERVEGRMALRRGFVLHPGERVVVVEDVITTGGSATEVWDLVGSLGAERLGVAALVDRSPGAVSFPLRAVVRMAADATPPETCPRCAAGEPIESPGSRHLG